MKSILIAIVFVFSTFYMQAQVGIGTSSPNTSAQLDVTSTTKGFLPPRMTASERTAIATPATGLLVYQTDGSAPGLYYYGGSGWIYILNSNSTLSVANGGTGTTNGSITGTGALTFTAGGTNQGITLTPSGTGVTLINGDVGIGTSVPLYTLDVKSTGDLISRFDGSGRNTNSYSAIGVLGPNSNGNIWLGVGGSTIDNTADNVQNNAYIAAENSLDGLNLRADKSTGYVKITAGGITSDKEVARFTSNGNVGIGTGSPNAKLDIRTSPTSTNDPGAGMLGIGTASSTTASSAGAGAVRYSTLSGGGLEFSNGSSWNTLQSNVQKANVYASRLSGSTFDVIHNTSNPLDGFTINSGAGNVAGIWDGSTGIYTAPRTGLYTISAGVSFLVKTATSATGIFHFLVMKNGFNGTEACNLALPVNYQVNQNMSANISCSVPLNQGETLQIKYHQWSGGTVQIALDPSHQGRYYFSIVEN